mgnify:CR=1 FL=1
MTKFMKKLLRILVLGLFLITPSWADDIRDLAIEDMSIGDSMLDYFSEKKIRKGSEAIYPKSDKFFSVTFSFEDKFKFYDGVQFHYKKNDKKYMIHSITGQIYYEDIQKCKKEMNKIVKEFSEMFPNTKKIEEGKREHTSEKGSFVYSTFFIFDSTDSVAVKCYDWSKKLNDGGMKDGLGVYISNREYNYFIVNEAYK